jgi:hypothetical protein
MRPAVFDGVRNGRDQAEPEHRVKVELGRGFSPLATTAARPGESRRARIDVLPHR